MAKKLNDRLSTKKNLLKVAAKLFAQKGYDAVSVRDIADKAKVNVALISYHFGSKEDLYKEIFRTYTSEHAEEVRGLLQQIASKKMTSKAFEELVFVLVTVALKRYEESPEICQLFHRERLDGLPHARETYEESIAPLAEILSDFIRLGQKQGIIRSDLHPKLFFATLFESIWGYMTISRCGLKMLSDCYTLPSDQKKYVQFLTKLFLEGSLKK